MLKSGVHKLAVVIAILAIGFMAACSSSSSTNDALTHPGDNYLGSLRFDVDPQAGTVDVTPVGSPWVMTSPTMPGDGLGSIPNITITSSNAVFSGGNTMDFDATVKWSDASSELNNVRIGVNASTNLDVVLTNDDNVACGGPWSGCLPANDPAITYVADDPADGRLDTETVAISQGCGAVTEHWTLFEGTGLGYKFWADLYGEPFATDLTADPRYDQYTASIYLRIFNADPLDATYPVENVETNSVASGEWFYVHYYVDAPGNGQTTGVAGSYPYADSTNNANHIEDTENIGRYGVTVSANYWYVGKLMPWTVRWDPAVIEVNSNMAAEIGISGNGLAKFSTAGGTKLRVITDWDILNGWNNQVPAYTTWNAVGLFKQITDVFAATYTPIFYPHPGNGADGFANIEWDVGSIAVRALPALPADTGSSIKVAFDSNTIVFAYGTEATPYTTADDLGKDVLRSFNYPLTWCERIPGGVCGGFFQGMYNNDREYICTQ